MKISPIQTNEAYEKIVYYRKEIVTSAVLGKYKNYKNAVKEYAKVAVDNFELAKTIKSPKINAPLFSKVGFNIMKVMFLNFFRIKTPAEKLMKKMGEEEKIKQKLFNKNI